MKLTYDARRVDISSCLIRLTEILEKYPFFGSKIWVCTEFEMMVGEGKIDLMKTNWEKYLPIIMSTTDESTSPSSPAVLQILDKNFRSGPTYKQQGIFQIYKNSTDIDTVIVDSSFPEPRLVLFEGDSSSTITQGFIVAEKNVIFEIINFSVFEGLVSLLATYYIFHVNYPKSIPASSLLYFIQEHLLEFNDPASKKPARYKAFINTLKKAADQEKEQLIEP
ncbi:PREDICTED: uncharacterized protein LOC109590087 [Amphimedon queenslandica]|uniref:Uncharacterized protein n=1 Tax=Amphimedon queenslandica TaxID=400682 RepID=A0A1X7T3Q2_AMPQE|nr:PREDICTED: uncharacterized protein LOC109590087 [Amphimedon queenslandica]|eukprot:XP_019861592.1 PREDICTED: uncharacterized protein LOC109590087 [Amphimedon queenslandica]